MSSPRRAARSASPSCAPASPGAPSAMPTCAPRRSRSASAADPSRPARPRRLPRPADRRRLDRPAADALAARGAARGRAASTPRHAADRPARSGTGPLDARPAWTSRGRPSEPSAEIEAMLAELSLPDAGCRWAGAAGRFDSRCCQGGPRRRGRPRGADPPAARRRSSLEADLRLRRLRPGPGRSVPRVGVMRSAA